MAHAIVLGDVEALAARIPDGASIALIRDEGGVAMAATRALIRRRVRGLRLITVPTGGLQVDLLIGAGCVAALETAGVNLGEMGRAPRFTRAVQAGAIALKDTTCPAIHAGLQAGEKGLPFIPLRGLIGSDLVRYRDDFKIIDNPFAADDPVVVLPAMRPDFALFHAPLGDRHGNVWIGRERDLMTMAHAARQTLVTVEKIIDGDLGQDPKLAPAILTPLYVTAVAEAANGAWPLALGGHYGADAGHIAAYARAAADDRGFAAYVAQHVVAARDAAE